MLNDIISVGLTGIALGAQYSLLALGFTLIFGILGVVNFAHGGFYVIGGYLAYCCTYYLGLPFFLAVLLATLGTFVLGFIFQVVVLRPVMDNELATLIITLGAYLIIVSALLVIFGPDAPRFNFPIRGRLEIFNGIFISYASIIIFILCVLMMSLSYYVIYKTNIGRGLRAMSDDEEIANAVGWPSKWLFALAFAFATALAGFTGALVTPILSLTPSVGDSVLVVSFLIVILGGIGSIGGATIAAFFVGLVETYTAVYVGGSVGTLALFILVIALLVVRPQGLAGKIVRGA